MEFWKIDENTWRITGAGCDCYLLAEGVMIDCGCANPQIRNAAEERIGRPVTSVICTHSHIDHTGMCGLFDHAYMTEGTSRSAKNWMDEDPSAMRLDYSPEYITDGEILRFGGRELEIIVSGVHARDNILILDRTHRILFTGDEIDRDQVLLLPAFAEKPGQYHALPAATVSDYRSMLRMIRERRAEYDLLCTGHNGSPLPGEVIGEMIRLCDDILEHGAVGDRDCAGPTFPRTMTHFPCDDAHYLRYTVSLPPELLRKIHALADPSEEKQTGLALIYCTDDLFVRENNSRVEPATPLHRMCRDNLSVSR